MMRNTMLMGLFVIWACADSPTQVGNVQRPPTPPAVASSREVMIGERVEGVFGDGRTITPGEHHFYITAPSNGTLEASLSWDPSALGTLLLLKLDGLVVRGSPPNWSPVLAWKSVRAGQRYLIAVALGGADWLPQDPFVLTTRLSPTPEVASSREVTIGERVEGVFGDGNTIAPGQHHFYVTAPSDGTLEVSLSWDPYGNGTLLLLILDGLVVSGTAPSWSPIVARKTVRAGQRYLIAVGLAGADWLPHDPFVLTTRLVP